MKINWDIDENEISQNGGIRESLERIVTSACPELEALHVSIRRLQDNRYICSLSFHPDGASEVMGGNRGMKTSVLRSTNPFTGFNGRCCDEIR